MDNTFIRESTPIDTIAMTPGIMEYVEGCQLYETNWFILSDH